MANQTVGHGACVHAGVLDGLFARLKAIMPDTTWRRRRFASHMVCPDCKTHLTLCYSRDQHKVHG